MNYLKVFVHALIGVIAALTLNYHSRSGGVSFAVVYGFVIILHGLRFLIWNKLLAKNDLSKLYPLSSIFFPLLFIASILLRLDSLSFQKIIGVLLILIGTFRLQRFS